MSKVDLNSLLKRLGLEAANPGAWSGAQGWSRSTEAALMNIRNLTEVRFGAGTPHTATRKPSWPSAVEGRGLARGAGTEARGAVRLLGARAQRPTWARWSRLENQDLARA